MHTGKGCCTQFPCIAAVLQLATQQLLAALAAVDMRYQHYVNSIYSSELGLGLTQLQHCCIE